MRVYTVVPVKEALHVDDIANLKTFNSLVNVSGVVAEIRLNGEGVGLSVQGNVEVQIAVGISRTGTSCTGKQRRPRTPQQSFP